MSARVAESVIAQTQLYLGQNRRHDPYEEPLRDVILTSRHDTIAYEDITGLPWIEIDYAVDVERATAEILPRIVAAARLGHPAMTTGGEAGRATYYE